MHPPVQCRPCKKSFYGYNGSKHNTIGNASIMDTLAHAAPGVVLCSRTGLPGYGSDRRQRLDHVDGRGHRLSASASLATRQKSVSSLSMGWWLDAYGNAIYLCSGNAFYDSVKINGGKDFLLMLPSGACPAVLSGCRTLFRSSLYSSGFNTATLGSRY